MHGNTVIVTRKTIKETLNFITEDEGEVNGYFQRDGNFQVTVEDLRNTQRNYYFGSHQRPAWCKTPELR